MYYPEAKSKADSLNRLLKELKDHSTWKQRLRKTSPQLFCSPTVTWDPAVQKLPEDLPGNQTPTTWNTAGLKTWKPKQEHGWRQDKQSKRNNKKCEAALPNSVMQSIQGFMTQRSVNTESRGKGIQSLCLKTSEKSLYNANKWSVERVWDFLPLFSSGAVSNCGCAPQSRAWTGPKAYSKRRCYMERDKARR